MTSEEEPTGAVGVADMMWLFQEERQRREEELKEERRRRENEFADERR